MATERSKALHNFEMPTDLQWGNRKFLRCITVNTNGQIPAVHHHLTRGNSDPSDQRRSSDKPKRASPKRGSPASSGGRNRKTVLGVVGGKVADDDGDDDGIAAVREKVMFDLQTAADKMKDAIFKDGLEEGEIAVPPPPPPPPPTVAAEGESILRPWNLRTRRAPVKFPSGGGGGGSVSSAVDGGMRPTSGISLTRASAGKSPVTTNDIGINGTGTSGGGEKRERPKFSVSLTKKEIEEDFLGIVGHRPPRRPKKRPRTVQKQLDTLFPGLWLTEVTPDMYKVPDAAP